MTLSELAERSAEFMQVSSAFVPCTCVRPEGVQSWHVDLLR